MKSPRLPPPWGRRPRPRQIAALLVLGLGTVDAYSQRLRSSRAAVRLRRAAAAGALASGSSEVQAGAASLEASHGHVVTQLLRGNGPPLHELTKVVERKMGVDDALRRLDGKLPVDITALVTAKSKNDYSEDALQHARTMLNSMISDSWRILDSTINECHEFTTSIRQTFDQVRADLAWFGSQLAELGARRLAATDGMQEEDRAWKDLEAQRIAENQRFERERIGKSQELTQAKNSLAVFNACLDLTQCQVPQNEFLQLRSGAPQKSGGSVHVCSTNDGLELSFGDPKVQARIERLMTPEARQALREALGQVQFTGAEIPQLLEVRSARGVLNVTAATGASDIQQPSAAAQARKCSEAPYNCGLLHDSMSVQWGKFRDSFDELSADMMKNQDDHDKLVTNLNLQLTESSDQKAAHTEALAGIIARIGALTGASSDKDDQRKELIHAFNEKQAICKTKVEEILFTDICAIRVIRNSLMDFSQTSPSSKIIDCDVSSWVLSEECADSRGKPLDCDDTCPHSDPFSCGGKEVITRDVLIAPNKYGVQCPALHSERRCHQSKCPVDCLMSQWSGWTQCTKECESGIQTRTRAILRKAQNGGTQCGTVEDERSCNTGSCDRDCILAGWSDWSPCSVACSMEGWTGFSTRTRKVAVPIRARGKCPKDTHPDRLERKECNTHACVGDEICIAQQDLIIALDASGSLKEEGFEALRAFAANLTLRYKDEYFGHEAMRVGVLLFGNGQVEVQPDGTTAVTSAKIVQPLTGDMEQVRTALQATTWQRGFTNMAQALKLADIMLSRGGRMNAQSAVLILSDGKYSIRYQTSEAARELKDNNVMLFMAPVTEAAGSELDNLKSWSSQPWETNFERIPGLDSLKFNADVFSQRVVVKFCPDSISPQALVQHEEDKEFMLVHEGGWPSDSCGHWTHIGTVPSLEDCAMKARDMGDLAFSFGKSYARNRCYAEAIVFTTDMWNDFKIHRRDPPCGNGYWIPNPYFDTYALKPDA